MQNGKERSQSESSPRIITEKNSISTNVNDLTPKVIKNLHGNGEYSGRLRKNYDSVDNIIKKYEEARLIKICNENDNQIVKKNNGILPIHALFAEDTELKNSVNNSRNKGYHISVMHNNVTKPNRAANGNFEPVVTFKEQNNINNKNIESCEPTGLTSKAKVVADKTTCCRPVVSLYNEEFIHRTMERNSKLKKLVKSLAFARQREKENVSWNNYINELKNKHGPSCNYSRRTRKSQLEPDQYIAPGIIDDCYTRFSREKSDPCRNLLHNLYEEYNDPFLPTRMYTDRQSHDKIQSQSNCYSLPYYNKSYCYLTSSQGRLIALERERRKNEYLNRLYNYSGSKCFKHINNHENKNSNLYGKQNSKDIYSYEPNNVTNFKQNCIKNSVNQTDLYFKENISRNKATNKIEGNVLIHEFIQAFESDNKIEEKHQDVRNNITAVTLVNIETKLSTLIDCINSFINEIKLERKLNRETKAVSVTCELADYMNTMKSDTVEKFDIVRTNKIVSGDESTLTLSNFYPCAVPKQSEIADVMKEIDQLYSKDRLYKSQPCSVNITFEVPTRDCCTEVTKSLSKQNLDRKEEEIEELSTDTASLPQMTIAVNTDPFNFLSLIRISMEALMHLLSNVPSINYQSYLAYLPFPQTTRKVESHYTCNICGAAFTKPSALSDHIQVHNLRKTRDCCVCRHVLDQMCRCSTPGRLFPCRCCGQRFCRAYCRDLHQRSCARTHGHLDDVSSSLMLLR